MIQDIVTNLIAGAISAAIVWVLKSIYRAIKSVNKSPSSYSGPKVSRRWVKNQFLICSVLTPVLLTAGVLTPSPPIATNLLEHILMTAKVLCFLIAFFSFILEVGAFDAAFAQYNPDNSFDIPADDNTNSDAENQHAEPPFK